MGERRGQPAPTRARPRGPPPPRPLALYHLWVDMYHRWCYGGGMKFSPSALRCARRRLDLSQSDLAKKVGVERKVIQRAESGKTTPQTETIVALAAVLHVEMGSLFTEENAA